MLQRQSCHFLEQRGVGGAGFPGKIWEWGLGYVTLNCRRVSWADRTVTGGLEL